MKLIDLLVQELPKRGGWPEGAVCATQDKDGEVCFSEGETPEFGLMTWHDGDWCGNEFHTITATDYDTAIITCAQYESALASSQKQAWNGEGVPPVGCECECQFLDAWHVCKVLFVGAEVIVGVIDGTESAISVNHTKFRPFQSEAERKREAAVKVIKGLLIFDYGDDPRVNDATFIYDAIAAGKIPGVKLDD